ncbi:MAG: DUF3565 domain-containing protein [Porticoccaceae bacterium]
MKHPIKNYHLDEEQYWVAELSCGHFQHLRHDPPWTSAPWVLTPKGRSREKLGFELDCKKCDHWQPPDCLKLKS